MKDPPARAPETGTTSSTNEVLNRAPKTGLAQTPPPAPRTSASGSPTVSVSAGANLTHDRPVPPQYPRPLRHPLRHSGRARDRYAAPGKSLGSCRHPCRWAAPALV